jgi:hypothetical protein
MLEVTKVEKTAKMTKAENLYLREIQQREAGLATVMEVLITGIGTKIFNEKVQFFNELKKRLNIEVDPVRCDPRTGEIRWNEPDKT